MAQGKPNRTLKPIPLDVLRDYELDLDIYANRAKAGIPDENARDAFDALIDQMGDSFDQQPRWYVAMGDLSGPGEGGV